MSKFILPFLLLVTMMSSGCITLFSEIHQESHQNHSGGGDCEELLHRVNELEERLHLLMERLEERGHHEEHEHHEERIRRERRERDRDREGDED